MGVSDRFLVKGGGILELIPQRPPIVMVDTLISVDETGVWVELTILPDNLFVSGGLFREPGLIEHAAQSCAVRMGYLCQQAGKPVPVGFIGALSHLKFHYFPAVGEVIRTRSVLEQEMMGVSLVRTSIWAGETLAAEGYLKIAIPKES